MSIMNRWISWNEQEELILENLNGFDEGELNSLSRQIEYLSEISPTRVILKRQIHLHPVKSQ